MQTAFRQTLGKVAAGLVAFVPATKALACTTCQYTSPVCRYYCSGSSCLVHVDYYDTCPPYEVCSSNDYGTSYNCSNCPTNSGGRC